MKSAKSFYIFDFDDNIIHTQSETYIYHKQTGEELTLTSSEYVQHRTEVGKMGLYEDYVIDPSPGKSFRQFADPSDNSHSPFLEDLKKATSQPSWQGPSWERFLKAINRQRTISIITARGHHPDRIREGIHWLAEQKLIPHKPDIHSIYAVTSPQTKALLKWTGPDLVSPLKKQALHHFIEQIYLEFGHEPDHRFGYSDDDPTNIKATRKKFLDLKQRNPHHCFFLYEAGLKEVKMSEVELSHSESH